MLYSLFNKSNNKPLKIPKIGLWFTKNKDEAIEMLKVCHEYLDSINASFLKDDIIIIDSESIPR